MLCQHCQKKIANVHFTQIVNNQKVELYLCEQCAKEKGQANFGLALNINDFFSGLIGFSNPAASLTAVPKEMQCEKCGMSFEEFRRTGKLGCSNCYTLFEDRLKPVLRRVHGNTEHNGKVPARLSKSIRVSREIGKLKELLNKAIQNEEYEKAADIRDRIKSLEVEK